MDLRISRSQTLRDAQGRDCIFIFFQSYETKPLAEISFRKIGVELNCLRELWNSLVAFRITAR